GVSQRYRKIAKPMTITFRNYYRKWWRRRESNPGPKITCSRIYVRSQQFESLLVAPAGGCSQKLVTCLFSRPSRGPGVRLSSLVYALGRGAGGPFLRTAFSAV